jgi:hypothetical protein
VEVTDSDNNTSLLRYRINYDSKKFRFTRHIIDLKEYI